MNTIAPVAQSNCALSALRAENSELRARLGILEAYETTIASLRTELAATYCLNERLHHQLAQMAEQQQQWEVRARHAELQSTDFYNELASLDVLRPAKAA